MAKKSIKNNQDEVLNEAKVPEDQVLHNTDDRKVEVKVPEDQVLHNTDDRKVEVKVPEDQVLHNTDDRKVEVKVPEINPASVVKIKALADTKHLKKDVIYEISGHDAIHLIKTKVAVLA